MLDLWWLYTIVLGMAFALVAKSIAEELKFHRTHPEHRLFITGIIWQIFIMLLITEVWVAFSFYVKTITSISVFSMFAFLVIPIGAFIMATVLDGNLPKSPDAPSEEEVFNRTRPLFFGVLIAIPVVNITHELILGNAGIDSDLLFQVLIIGGGVLGLLSRRRTFDNILGVAMSVLILVYIVLDYATISVK